MASGQAGAPAPKPSFAKIAAAGLKPPAPSPDQSNNSSSLQKHAITSAPRDSPHNVTPSSGTNPMKTATQPKKAVEIASQPMKEQSGNGAAGPEVHVHNVDATSPQATNTATPSGLLAPAVPDDSNTQVSSSSGSVKPPSIDGKSVASGTTFAMDEKESLRPDDSASAKAAEEDDMFLPPGPVHQGRGVGPEDGGRAFRDQLREITAMEPSRRGIAQPVFGPAMNIQKGMLYIPPQGPGVGMVPGIAGAPNAAVLQDPPPDSKLLDAVRNPGERIYVLKLQTDIVDFINDAKETTLTLPQTNTYHRMLAHRAAEYYGLGHVLDESAESVRLFRTPGTRLRAPLIDATTPSTATNTPPPTAPQMKILRRGVDAAPAIVNGSNLPSKSTSENDESGNEDDKRPGKPRTFEEKQAHYAAARLRILGSANDAASAENSKTMESSRSSSAAGKKPKKKQRSDSDDDFEARSAYTPSYYTPPFSSDGYPASSYGFPAYAAPLSGNATPSKGLNTQGVSGAFPPYPMHGQDSQWSTQSFHQGAAPHQQWSGTQQPSYDLSGDFRAMSLQNSATQHVSAMSPSFDNTGYPQQFYGTQQSWPQQGYPMQPQSAQNMLGSTGYYGQHQSRPTSSANHIQANQPYQYGQLPSQTFPGRQPSRLEHPLPGSYKSKHFNPQSQTFVPGQQDSASSLRPFTPQGVAPNTLAYGAGYAMPSPLNRQTSAQGSSSGYPSPHHPSAMPAPAHVHGQTMMHPLPQPVFPQQPSPSLPLPPKPGSTPQRSPAQHTIPQSAPNAHSPSTIAKWGTPASLPAKPPPPAEPFDPAKFSQFQSQPSYNTAAAARMPSGGIPAFGSMPPMANGVSVNGGMGAHRQ